MAVLELAASLNALPVVSLAELDDAAELQHRRDRKYIVPLAELHRALDSLPTDTRVLDIDGLRTFRYESVYFDTTDRESYYATARSRPRRRKVRTRSYLDTRTSVLEVKVRERTGETRKTRAPHSFEHRTQLDMAAREFITDVDPTGTDPKLLEPALTTRYTRSTLLIDGHSSRATIDSGLRFESLDGTGIELDGHAIVETKSTRGSTPIDRLLWQLGLRPTAFSKYCVGLAALDNRLPANKWNRVLRRHYAWAPARVGAGLLGSTIGSG